VKRWIAHYHGKGEDVLIDRSARPHTSVEVEQAVHEARWKERIGREEMAARLGVSVRPVWRILIRHGVPPLRTPDPITGEVFRASKTTAARYEREGPGELVRMDVRKLGKIPDGGG
jgi:SRSO17 transposase